MARKPKKKLPLDDPRRNDRMFGHKMVVVGKGGVSWEPRWWYRILHPIWFVAKIAFNIALIVLSVFLKIITIFLSVI